MTHCSLPGPASGRIKSLPILVAALCLAACLPPHRSGPPRQPAWLDLAAGCLYQPTVLEGGSIQLQGGEFIHPASRTRATLTENRAWGDLDGDGRPEGVVELVVNTGGSGTFHDLVALSFRGGMPRQEAAAFLGDRVRLKSIEVRDGMIVVRMITQGPGDPLCCPTLEVIRKFRLAGEALTER